MLQETINASELRVFELILPGPLTVSEIVQRAELSISWVSECLAHLEQLWLVERRKEGLTVRASLARTRTAEALRLLLKESPYIAPSGILTGPGLVMLPLLLWPGATPNQISSRTSVSARTARRRIQQWRGMGVVIKRTSPLRYLINPERAFLEAFVEDYSMERNQRFLRSVVPSAVMIWHWRDEILFTTDGDIEGDEFLSAGPTRLGELGYNIVSTRMCYLYSQDKTTVGDEEALVQTLRMDPENPRPMRFIREAIGDGRARVGVLLEFARKYEVTELVRKGGVGAGK